ncbi:Ran GTPase-activating protein [Melia azedarach]|uniref:Ran GTPase-activating protein n=1 Tax=Melia azedarach TaxID=155640 RepID=A0ACC1YFK6_MELAZ|nr:Ran GTPase-activating protein [Melia azedarach]
MFNWKTVMGRRKTWWAAVPCTMSGSGSSRRSLRSESMKNIEEILKSKLATIKEEDPVAEEYCLTPSSASRLRQLAKKGKSKIRSKAVIGRLFLPQLISFKHSLRC